MPISRETPIAKATAPTAARAERTGPCPPLDEAISRAEAERIAKLFKALADPTRVQLLGLLRGKPGGECGYDMTGPLGISQPSVSYHVKVLHEAGLVARERRGSWVFYRICEERLAEIHRLVGSTSPVTTP